MELDLINNFPILESERLILRRIEPGDAESIFEYASDEEVCRYLSWGPHKSIEDTRLFLNGMVFGIQYIAGVPDWAVELKENGKMIGTIGVVKLDPKNEKAEVGYVLHKNYWGRGLMTEALDQVLKFCFETMKLNRIEAVHRLENRSSGRVMEKCGMRPEGILRQSLLQKGEHYDVKIYSILREEFVKGIKIQPVLNPNFRITTEAVVRRGDRILLTKRANNCFVLPGIWCVPAGKAKLEELPEDGVVREVKEETGLDVNVVSLLSVYPWKGVSADGEEYFRLVYIYLVEEKGEAQELVFNDEHTDHAWVNREEIESEKYYSLLPELKREILEKVLV